MQILFSEFRQLIRVLQTKKFTPGAINILLLILLFAVGLLAFIFDESGLLVEALQGLGRAHDEVSLDPTIWLLVLTGSGIVSLYTIQRTRK